MKRVLFIGIILFFFFPVQATFAAEPATQLKTADIKLVVDPDHTYTIVETVTLSNTEAIQDGIISHTFSNIEGSQPENLVVTSGGEDLQSKWEEGKTISKLQVNLPGNTPSEFTYELHYQLKLQADSFITPLFVPVYPTAGSENVIHISFTAPEGEKLSKNSFPVIINDVENEVQNSIMNIPSHVKYVYGEGAGGLNIFNIVSWGVILGLLIIIVTWFRAEVKSKKGAAA